MFENYINSSKWVIAPVIGVLAETLSRNVVIQVVKIALPNAPIDVLLVGASLQTIVTNQ